MKSSFFHEQYFSIKSYLLPKFPPKINFVVNFSTNNIYSIKNKIFTYRLFFEKITIFMHKQIRSKNQEFISLFKFIPFKYLLRLNAINIKFLWHKPGALRPKTFSFWRPKYEQKLAVLVAPCAEKRRQNSINQRKRYVWELSWFLALGKNKQTRNGENSKIDAGMKVWEYRWR